MLTLAVVSPYCRLLALWLARGVGICLRMRGCIPEFSLAQPCVVTALADRATESGQPQSSGGVVLRFLLRYVLMALGAYVIFTVSPASLYGLLAGLFLPVAAIVCEAAYEGWAAVGKGV